MDDLPFHPLSEGYPLLEGDDYERFAADVQARGLLLPIVKWHGHIIDGRNRYRVCKERGVPPAYVDDSHVEENDLEAHIAALNEHRRHLAPAFLRKKRKERVGTVAEKRRSGKSTRQIAEETGVSEMQVRRDLRKATATGDAVEPAGGKVEGKDGRKRTPRPRRKATPSPDSTATGVAVEGPPDSTATGVAVEGPPELNGIAAHPSPPPRDAVGLSLPENLVPAFAARERFAAALSLRRQLVTIIDEVAKSPGGIHLPADLSRRERAGKVFYRSRQLDELKEILEGNAPHSAVCPYCHDRHPGQVDPACKACHGLGWVTLRVWQRAPREERDAVEVLAGREGGAP